MKNAKVKSILTIVGTLLIGILLGAMIATHLIRGRIRDFIDMRGGERFQKEVIIAAEPTPEQEAAIKPILQDFAAVLDSMHTHHREELLENLSDLEAQLALHLSAKQIEKVKKHLHRLEGRGHHGRGHGRGHGHGHGEGHGEWRHRFQH
jgi:hypothetical protein